MKQINDLYRKLEVCGNDDDRLETLFDLATEFLNFDEKRVLQTAEDIKALAEHMDSNLGRAYYHSTLGRVFFKKSQFAECETEFNKALDLSLLTTDLITQAMCYDSLGILYTFQNSYQEALNFCYKALAIYEQVPGLVSKRFKTVCHNNIGATLKTLYRWDEAETHFLEGLSLEVDEPDKRMHCNLLSNLSTIKIYQKRYDDGLAIAQKASEGFKLLQHKNGEVNAIVLFGQCYLGKGEYATALTHYLAALKRLKEVDHKTVEILALRGIGEVYMKMEAYQEAQKYLQQAIELAKEIGDEHEAIEACLILGQNYQLLNNPDEATKAYEMGLGISKNHGVDPMIELFNKHIAVTS